MGVEEDRAERAEMAGSVRCCVQLCGVRENAGDQEGGRLPLGDTLGQEARHVRRVVLLHQREGHVQQLLHHLHHLDLVPLYLPQERSDLPLVLVRKALLALS